MNEPTRTKHLSTSLLRRALCCALLGALGCGEPGETDAGARDAGATDAGPPDAGPPREWPLAEVPSVTEPEAGIRREVLTLAASTPPVNPLTGEATPSALDRTQVVRFSGTDRPDVRAVVIMVPGFLGGAGSFEMLARHLVRRSLAASEPIEVWAIDRRSNLLEDLRGLDAAEAMGEPDLARGYYFGDDTVGGESFAGFRRQSEVSYMSEWGLETHVNDVRLVIDRIAETDRRARVFLLGHSLGASFAEAFAAWRFDDMRGAEMLAGVILVDGAVAVAPLDEASYVDGTSTGLAPLTGLDEVRSSTRFVALPILGVDVYARAEIAAMEAMNAPDEISDDPGHEAVLALLFSAPGQRLPAMTHRAAFGFAFDDQYDGLSFAAASLGHAIGGPTEEYESLFGPTLIRPSDPSATYDWVDAADADPPEQTPIANLAHSWIDGHTNFAEWYFPARLTLDLAAVGGLAIEEGGYQANAGLLTYDGSLVDAPVLAIAAALAPPARYETARLRMAAVGADRPNAGATRNEAAGFQVLDVTGQTHIDPLTAADTERNPVPATILAFVQANAAPGRMTVTLP